MNVLTSDKKSTIRTLLKNGISQHEIFRKTGIDRKTVRKYAKLKEKALGPYQDLPSLTLQIESESTYQEEQNPPPRPPADDQNNQDGHIAPSHARSACEVHRPWIEEQVKVGRNAVSIYQDLVERYGFTNKYNSVKRFVRGLKRKDPKQFDRLEFLPGEESHRLIMAREPKHCIHRASIARPAYLS